MKPCKTCEELKNAVSVEVMRNSDKYTIENYIDSKTLMYRAACGVYNSTEWLNKKTAIICGSGNNGGDGYALAGILADKGMYPTLYRVSERFSEDGLFYYNEAIKKGISDLLFTENTPLNGYDIIVDCLLGTGFTGSPRGLIKTAIEAINSSGAYVISVDINSGLNGDTGTAVTAVCSDLTVSIGFYKKGHFLNDAEKYINELINVDIGIVLHE